VPVSENQDAAELAAYISREKALVWYLRSSLN